LASEAAWTFCELALDEPPALVTACRRLLESHVTVGPLWWVAATVLVAPDPEQAARRAVGELCADRTAELLAEALSQRLRGDSSIVVVCPADTVREAFGYGPAPLVRIVGSSPELRGEVRSFAGLAEEASGWEYEEAREAVDGVALVLVEALAAGPRGVLVDARAVQVVQAARAGEIPVWAVAGVGRVLNDQLLGEMLRRAGRGADLIEPADLDAVVGPAGVENPGDALGRSGCPMAPELLVRAG
jgi:hypothetical protein